VRLLETCQADGIFSGEIAELLEFARMKPTNNSVSHWWKQHLPKPQGLLAKGAYVAAIRLLEPVVQKTSDVSMRALLDKARSQEQALQQKIGNVLSTAQGVGTGRALRRGGDLSPVAAGFGFASAAGSGGGSETASDAR